MEFSLVVISLFAVLLVVWIVWPERKTDLPGLFRVGVIVVFLAVVIAIGLGHTIVDHWPTPAGDARASQKSLR